jgi:hypothetical protein
VVKVRTFGELLNAALNINLAALCRISAFASNALTVVFYSKRTIWESLEVGADRKSPTSGELLRATLLIKLAAFACHSCNCLSTY